MIYFDNAATGGFKPRAVTDAAQTVIRYLCANPGRSGHRLSVTGADIVYKTRLALAKTFNASPERVIFTKNCTEALNQAIFGSLKIGGHIITTVYEHNSVLRPLSALQKKGLITLDVVKPSIEKDLVTCLKEKITPSTYLIIATGVSNVTGEKLPITQISSLCFERGILYLCDGAQAGGHIPIDVKKHNISMLALAGHKGLYGIMGSGVLIINDDVELEPLIYGGTGSESFNLNQPLCYPERLESGTLNLPAIAALKEGVDYVSANLSAFGQILLNSTTALIEQLKKINGIKIYSRPNETGIVAFSLVNVGCADLADRLNNDYDIAVRSGLHCAPLMHEFLGTLDGGLVRASLSVQNSPRELNNLIRAVAEISEG